MKKKYITFLLSIPILIVSSVFVGCENQKQIQEYNNKLANIDKILKIDKFDQAQKELNDICGEIQKYKIKDKSIEDKIKCTQENIDKDKEKISRMKKIEDTTNLISKGNLKEAENNIVVLNNTNIKDKKVKEMFEQCKKSLKDKKESIHKAKIEAERKKQENYKTVGYIEEQILKKFPFLSDRSHTGFSLLSNEYNKFNLPSDYHIKPYVEFEGKKGYIFKVSHTADPSITLKEAYDNWIKIYTTYYLVDTNNNFYDCDYLYDLKKSDKIRTINCNYQISDLKVDPSYQLNRGCN